MYVYTIYIKKRTGYIQYIIKSIILLLILNNNINKLILIVIFKIQNNYNYILIA